MPVCAEGVIGKGSAHAVNEHMGFSLFSKVLCQQQVTLEMEPDELGKLLGKLEADGGSAPRLLILVMGEVEAEAWLLRCAKQELIAMAQGPMPAIWVEARPLVAGEHKGPDAGQPDGGQVPKDHAGKGHIVHGSGLVG